MTNSEPFRTVTVIDQSRSAERPMKVWWHREHPIAHTPREGHDQARALSHALACLDVRRRGRHYGAPAGISSAIPCSPCCSSPSTLGSAAGLVVVVVVVVGGGRLRPARAVAAGRCDLTSPGAELRVDGRWFCDQLRVRALVDAGLLRPASATARGRAPATLTEAGRASLAGP